MKRYFFTLSIFAYLILFFTSCANTSSPTGGVKDTIPPVIKSMEPANGTVFFNEEKIVVKFNEFVQLKDLQNQLLVSPPVNEKPEITLKGKGFVIKLKDTLQQNTTYSISLGDAVQDYTESNVFPDFRYLLSTGKNIDSLWLMGKLVNSFTLLPEENFLILLYSDLKDSIPFQKKPNYVARTSKEGIFKLTNLSEGKYRLFAIKDGNSDLIYNAGEPMAFCTYFIELSKKGMSLIDKKGKPFVYKDKENIIIERAPVETVHAYIDDSLRYVDFIVLKSFKEDKERQYISEVKRETENKLQVVFKKPVNKKIELKLLNAKNPKDFLFEIDKEKRVASYWLKDTLLMQKDSIHALLTYFKSDSLLKLKQTNDTLIFRFIHEKKESSGGLFRRKEKETVKETIKIQSNLRLKKLDLGTNFNLIFENPLKKVDLKKIKLIKIKEKDSIPVTEFKLIKEKGTHTVYKLDAGLEQGMDYKLEMLSGAFIDFHDTTNDTTAIHFSVRKNEDYGKIILFLKNVDRPHVFQLLDEKEKVLQTIPFKADTTLNLNYILPGKVVLKAFEDKNNDGEWTTGDYLKGLQADRVKYYMPENEIEKITIKENWENEITWDLKK